MLNFNNPRFLWLNIKITMHENRCHSWALIRKNTLNSLNPNKMNAQFTGVKLTLVSLRCRCKAISAFVNLPTYNNKAVLHQSTIDMLFLKFWGFKPERGETISIG